MTTQFVKIITGINIGNDGDGIDKLHFSTVPNACMGCLGLLVLIKFMNILPIVCWVPYQFTNKDWVEYATYYCYVSNTFLPNNKEVFGPEALDDIKNGDIFYLKYYQWVPFIFIVIAIIFYLPRLVWQGILEAEGVNITAMVKTVNGFAAAFDPEKREKALDHLSKYMMAHFNYKKGARERRNDSAFKRIMGRVMCVSRSDPSYVGKSYLFLKLLELGNAIGMLFFLNLWLDGYHLYGFEVIAGLFRGNYAEVNKFPYLTFCNVSKQEINHENSHQFLCLLSMNLFYEKIFTLFWFFLLMVAVKTIINVIGWFRIVLAGGLQAGYIKNILRLSKTADYDATRDADDFREFVRKFLKPDGVFIFQIINRNTSTIVMQEVIGKLWNQFKEQKQEKIEEEMKIRDEAEAQPKKNELYPTL